MLESLTRLISRFRYPVSHPEDISHDLGMNLPNHLKFGEFLKVLSSPNQQPARLYKKMSRSLAEMVFETALKKECFGSCSLFSYYFNKGWLVFALYFDEKECLRRVTIQSPSCEKLDKFDLSLREYII